MDIWSKEKRSIVMSKIKGKNTKPEIKLRSQLFKKGFRFRIHKKDLPGKPDIVLPKYKLAIFVHGCFWHYHKDCKEGRIPSTNSEFWKEKLENNMAKDEKHVEALKINGWRVMVIWECEIENKIDLVMKKIIRELKKFGLTERQVQRIMF
jgi:DNA mismatch endonuclease (patch repair protein)